MKPFKLRIILLLIFAAISWKISHAQTGFEFKGTIGKYPVVMYLQGYISGIVGDIYYVSQGKDKKLYLEGEYINDLENPVLTWKINETYNGKYNGTFNVEWNAFVGGSQDIVGKYTNIKGKTYDVNLKCTRTESLRED